MIVGSLTYSTWWAFKSSEIIVYFLPLKKYVFSFSVPFFFFPFRMIYSFFKTYSSAKLHHLYWENRRLIYVSDTKKKTKKNLAHIHYTRLTTHWINDNSYLRRNLHSSFSTYAVRFVLIRWSLPARTPYWIVVHLLSFVCVMFWETYCPSKWLASVA